MASDVIAGPFQPVIPKVVQEAWGEWQVYCSKTLIDFLMKDGQWSQEFQEKVSKLITIQGNNFRIQLNIDNAELLFAFFLKEKEIRIYTPRLSQELFLLEHLNREDFSNDEFFNFKEHADKVACLLLESFPSTYELTTHQYDLDQLQDDKIKSLAQDEQELMDKLLLNVNDHSQGLFEKISDFALGLTAEYKLLRIHMLKFLAILPNLDHDKKGFEVKRILIESMRRLLTDSSKAKLKGIKGEEKPLSNILNILFSVCFWVIRLIPANILTWGVRTSVKFMAKRFIAGESIDQVKQSFDGLFRTGRDITLDQLGELVVSEKEADHYCEEVLKLVHGLGQYIPKGSQNSAGVNRAHVSIKVSALCRDMKPEAFEYSYKLVAPRLKKILLAAKEKDVFINIDAEHYHFRDVVFKIYKKILLETEELRDYQQTGIVVQAYLRDCAEHLEEIIELARERKHCMPLRLVKGAYWDAETVEADAHSFDAPEFLNKEETDLNFRQMILKILAHYPHIQLCVASHNIADHCFAEVARNNLYQAHPEVEHQCLHMTYEALSTGMAKMNWPVRNYVPIGGLLVGMAYLVRRIMENSSQVGVLTIMRSHKNKHKPLSPIEVHLKKKEEGKLARDMSVGKLSGEFFNIAPVRNYLEKQHRVIVKALDKFKNNELGKEYKNTFLVSGEEKEIHCSSDPSILVGKIKFANIDDAKRALELVDTSFNTSIWPTISWVNRASILLKAATLMTLRRDDLAALITYEAGKSINESYADVDEAVDFLNFYAREERKYAQFEETVVPRGPVVAITPWNFPLAIPAGMIAAPLVAGNTVILKSAEQTPLIAQVLVDLFHEAGVPQDVLIHLPGEGETVGDYLVRSEKISTIVFTGSKAVGTLISKVASQRLYKDKHPVKVVTEMGGKNAIIVTANAELDETVAGILSSAFGHAGQKCSAASRVLVDESIKDRLIERLEQACLDIEVTSSLDFSCAINPVITLEDKERLQRQVAEACEEAKEFKGRVIVNRSREELPGYCVGPTLIELPFDRAKKKESFAQRELFGPVLHLIPFKHIDQALEIYNITDYGLTGGVFGQSQDDIDYCLSKMYSGNIYINRNITGARVGVEPFGGFKLSGTGPKAGSKDYAKAFRFFIEDAPNKSLDIEWGRDTASLAYPRKGNTELRIDQFHLLLTTLENQFESLFGGINLDQKNLLHRYRKWSEVHLNSFIHKEHLNNVIPGQISFNNYELTNNRVCFITENEQPYFKNFLSFLSALSLGAGVTIVCLNSKSYKWWSVIKKVAQQFGWSDEYLKVSHCSEEEFEKLLNNPKLHKYLLDGNAEHTRRFNEKIINSNAGVYMNSILTSSDGPRIEDFKSISQQFVLVRSFAINTMRHGAPLELEL